MHAICDLNVMPHTTHAQTTHIHTSTLTITAFSHDGYPSRNFSEGDGPAYQCKVS